MTLLKINKMNEAAEFPTQEQGNKHRYYLSSPYTTTITKGSNVAVSSGLAIEKSEDVVVFTTGNAPPEWSNDLEIKESFNGTGGELKIYMTNHTECDIGVLPFSKIASFYLVKACGGDPIVVDELDSTDRGEFGFGSTGLK